MNEHTGPSDRPLRYTRRDLVDWNYGRDAGDPGRFPYTRGTHQTSDTSRPWAIRSFAGIDTPEATNAQLRALQAIGATDLGVAFDRPTRMGQDADQPEAAAEVGRDGVSVSSLADMEALVDGLSLADLSVSLAVDEPAAILLAMYLVAAERRGVDWRQLSGTVHNDSLGARVRGESVYPPGQAMRLAIDVAGFGAEQLPGWTLVAVGAADVREAGAAAGQELTFAVASCLAYVDQAERAGLSPAVFVPRLSCILSAHRDFFVEIAKFRAVRRIWARIMRERVGAEDADAMRLSVDAVTTGRSLAASEPSANAVRTALRALAAVVGGVQSLETRASDATPEAATLAVRTQQILATESGVADLIDAFGGSYLVERLTSDLEAECRAGLTRLEAMGGMLAAIDQGMPWATESAASGPPRASRGPGQSVHLGDRSVVSIQRARLAQVRRRRDADRAARALARVGAAARGGVNLMDPLIDAVRVDATLGEISGVLRDAWARSGGPAIE